MDVTHIKVEIQSNSEFQSWTRSPGPPRLQLDLRDTYEIGFGHYTYARKEDNINFPIAPVLVLTKIGCDKNCWNNFNIQSPTHLRAVHIKTDAQVAYDIQLVRSWIPWKGTEITFPIKLVSCQNSSGIVSSSLELCLRGTCTSLDPL
jgi:hypothetical protein